MFVNFIIFFQKTRSWFHLFVSILNLIGLFSYLYYVISFEFDFLFI